MNHNKRGFKQTIMQKVKTFYNLVAFISTENLKVYIKKRHDMKLQTKLTRTCTRLSAKSFKYKMIRQIRVISNLN